MSDTLFLFECKDRRKSSLNQGEDRIQTQVTDIQHLVTKPIKLVNILLINFLLKSDFLFQ